MQSRDRIERTIANLIGRRASLWNQIEEGWRDPQQKLHLSEMLFETEAAIQALYWAIGDDDVGETNLCRVYAAP